MARPKSMPTTDRFWSKVQKTENCWLWMGTIRADGYGGFALTARKTVGAHRYSWELANGHAIPASLCVLHSCDVPLCVNPAHLRVGTNAENSADAKARGRTKAARGSAHPAAKLNEEQVRAILARYAAGEKRSELAKAFGVSWDLIHGICVLRANWKHMTGGRNA